MLEQEAADLVDADLGGSLLLGEHLGRQVTGPVMLDEGVETDVPLLGDGQRSPGAGHGHQDRQRQQHGIQDGQHTGGGDQGDQAVQRAGAVADHPAGGVGPEPGPVQEPVELVILDRRQLHPVHQGEVPLGRHPLDLGLQRPGRRR
ncbi:hypothetical protein [Streptomyces sp. NPDC049916]|uniref:hypothetical protein n=1 Tax=Streptomyces sp. NPDC049916 TaxID=3155156 RepID=UPI00343847E8